MERSIEMFAALVLAATGLSFLVRPGAWVEYFKGMLTRGASGVFPAAFLTLLLGSVIVAFHNSWTGIPAVLTAIGWIMVVKGTFLLLAPEVALRMWVAWLPANPSPFYRLAGVFYIALAGLLAWHLCGG